ISQKPMHERLLPASPNWYCSRCSDTNDQGILGFGAKNIIYLIDVTATSSTVVGELVGHRERVSGFSFCQHPGQSHICASSSDDGTVKFWDTNEKVLLKEHKVHQNTITALHWSPEEKNLVVSADEKGILVCHWYNTGESQSFFPEPRNIFCLSCSPHNWHYIAVGYKDGMIVLIDISKKGEVVHRFRGHDDEIHALAWAPVPNEEMLYNSEVTEGTEKGCYLASGSKDQTIRIWSMLKGKGVMTMKLPFLKRRGIGVDPAVKERLWLSVHWPKGKPTQVVSSCFGGELILWDLTKGGKQKWCLLGTSSEGQNHSRIVFNMSSVCVLDNRELLISTSMDRQIKCWDLLSLDCCWTLPTLGGFVYALTFSPVGTGCLALGVGDSMVRVWSTLSMQNKYDTKTFWQGIKSKVTALSWHPTKEGSLAFGTDDGKVGIYDVFSNKPPHVSSTYHRKTVYTLAWGPPVPPLSFGGAGDRPSYSLYSCAGEGLILQHDPWKLTGEATDIDRLIKDTNSIKHKLSPHTDLSWKPDGKFLAIGNEDGSIEVYQAPNLKLLCTIQQHHKIINVLRWHHDHGSQPELQYLLASGSSNAVVYVHDIRTVIESPPVCPIVMTEAYRSLAGHTAKITSLAWSPHHDGRLVTVCYDGTAQVWDVQKEEALCNYRGHRGRLLCVQWSPVDPDLVWTGADDFTVHEWAVSKQKFSKPPKGRKHRAWLWNISEFESKKNVDQKLKVKAKKKKKGTTGNVGLKVEEGLPLNGTEDRRGVSLAPGDGPSDNEDDDDIEEGNKTNSVSSVTVNRSHLSANTPLQVCMVSLYPLQLLVLLFLLELSLKKRKPRSMMPLSTSMDHRPREDLQQDCLKLATVRHSDGLGDHIQLGLFADRDALYKMFHEEEQAHVESGHYESVMYLRMWKGDIAGALQVATEKGELSDHLLSVAPMAGYQVWLRTVEAYVKQLCLQEQFLKAASHLLSINHIYEAIDLLKSHQLYREAIALAKARLQQDDPVLKELYTTWAAVLEKDGHLSTAAKCYLAVDSGFDAVKVIAKKNDPVSLKTAASLAKITGESDLSHSLYLRCAKDLASSQDWLGAQQLLSAQESLLVSCLFWFVFQRPREAQSSLPTTEGLRQSSDCTQCSSETGRETPASRPWAALVDNVNCMSYAYGSTVMALVPLQLLSHLSLDVTLSTVSWLLGDWGSALEELLHGVARASTSISQYKKMLEPLDGNALAAAQSLEAFVCYQDLYHTWWNCSTKATAGAQANLTNGLHSPSENRNKSTSHASDTSEGDADTRLSVSTCQLLLSEPHATCQATQKAITEIQERLASMVHQHSQTQEAETISCEEQTEKTSSAEGSTPTGSQESSDAGQGACSHSRPCQSKRLSYLKHLLSFCPATILYFVNIFSLPFQKYPYPDVLEGCLVLLYLSKSSALVPDHLQEEAMALLRKFGTTSSLCKASKRFLS
uniref:Anaphase-promoting complex subunit 4 WD40 domain-containing protein n=1 Tax=Esox lucius TaxID=8010 RepID=A0A6Q2YA73_ESOLU